MSDLSALTHQITDLAEVKDAFILNRKVFHDDRGFFAEVTKNSIDKMPQFAQQNTSFSYGGVLRGMHTQKNNPQGKLVTCLYGTILDVIFDIRKDSPTFGKGFSMVLEFDKMESVFVPPGVLHGFFALSRFAVVHYSCTTEFDRSSDGGVNWESPEIRGYFPGDILPTVSQKDRALPTLSEYLETII